MTILAFNLGGFEIIAILLAILPFLVLPIFALVDVVRNQFRGNDKLIWVIIILFLPFIGSILYLFVGRKTRISAS